MSSHKEALKNIRSLIKDGKHKEAWQALAGLDLDFSDYAEINKAGSIFAKIDKSKLGLTPLRVAFLGEVTLGHWAPVFALALGLRGFEAKLHLGEFGTLSQQVLDPQSSLYAFKPDVVWFFNTYRDYGLNDMPGAHDVACQSAVQAEIQKWQNLWAALQKNSNAFVVQNHADLPSVSASGNLAGSVPWSETSLLGALNKGLSQAAPPGVALFDLQALAATVGSKAWFDHSYYYHSKHPFGFDAIGPVAKKSAGLLAGVKGQSKKALVLDLDNTLWGGVIGDDGLAGINLSPHDPKGEAYIAFQRYALALKNRGVLLAVCSKNDEGNAKAPFEKHEHMVLKLDDLSVFTANWEDKATNLKAIAKTLNMGLEALVFVDDNPAERALIKQMLPEVAVVPLPEQPAGYIEALDRGAYFETLGLTQEDQAKTAQYQAQAKRSALEAQCGSLEDFLKGLQMKATAIDVDNNTLTRTAQLINKSNQFHLTTTRYTENQLQSFIDDPNYILRAYSLADAYGDHGQICTVILKKEADTLVVDTWVMSCRVLQRGVEQWVAKDLWDQAQGAQSLTGLYKPSGKNQMTAKLYPALGFALAQEDKTQSQFTLKIEGAPPDWTHFIEAP